MTGRSDNQNPRRCTAIKRNGEPCRGWAVPGTDPPRCAPHRAHPRPDIDTAIVPEKNIFDADSPRRCSAITAAGRPCLGWAVRGSDPPLCPAHGGGRRGPGAPLGNDNAWIHGFYAATTRALDTIDEIIADLAEKQILLSDFITETLSDPDGRVTADGLMRVFALHGQNASRLGRLLRDRRALSGDAADGISAAIAQALEELQTELGTQLVGDE
jgi:hypothetical protein